MQRDLQKNKICYLITGLNTGGAEMMLYRLIEKLDRSRYDIVVISILPLGKVVEKIKKLGVHVMSLEMRSKFDVLVILRLVHILRNVKPTILHSHLFHANFLGRVAGKMARVSIIFSTIHTTKFGGKIRELALRYTDSLSDATTIICETAAKRMIKRHIVPREKLYVIYNGIDHKLYEGLGNENKKELKVQMDFPLDQTVLLSVGRLQEEKGYPYLIQSASELKKRGHRFIWMIAGDGELRSRLEQLTKENDVEDRIQFLGLRDDVPQLLWASDIFVLSSLWEGLPGVVLEAMAAGLPVVATEVGGTPELIEDGKNGYLVPPRNPQLMADAIEKVINMKEEERRMMGRKGLEKVKEKFTIEQMVRGYEELYKEFLMKKGIMEL